MYTFFGTQIFAFELVRFYLGAIVIQVYICENLKSMSLGFMSCFLEEVGTSVQNLRIFLNAGLEKPL